MTNHLHMGILLGLVVALIFSRVNGKVFTCRPVEPEPYEPRDVVLEPEGWVYTTIPNEYGAVTRIWGVPWSYRMIFRLGFRGPLRRYLTRL